MAYKPCKKGQYRDSKTKRCRKYVTKAGLKASKKRLRSTRRGRRVSPKKKCGKGQYYNPSTKRCRKYVTKAGLKASKKRLRSSRRKSHVRRRSKFTRKQLSAAKKKLRKPCKKGQYRHPKTKRCRSYVTPGKLRKGREYLRSVSYGRRRRRFSKKCY